MFKVFKNSTIESNYTIPTNPLFSSDGWSIYPAKHKQTKKACSVWIFDKKKFEATLTKLGVITKSNKHLILGDAFEVLKNYVSSLVKLKHPSILQVYEPLEDHKSRALFVTEYVVHNLAKIDKQDLDEIMITKGLLQVSDGVKFLHDTLQSVHLNIQPSTIFINENFDWKLSGLNFLQNIESGSGEIDTFDPRMPGFVNINFRFSSPDLVLNRKLAFQHDLFSLGCVIYYLFNSKNVNSSSPFVIGCENNNISEYQRDVKKLTAVLQGNNASYFRNIPENYISTLMILLNYTKNQWDISQFMESNIFNNELIKIMNFFDSFLSQDLSTQHMFLNKFKEHSLKFPKILLLNKFLPILVESLNTYTKDPKKQVTTEEEALITTIVENIFLISQTLSQLTFMEKVFPKLDQTIRAHGLISAKITIINNLNLIETKLGINENNNKNVENFDKFLLALFKDGIISNENGQQQLLFQERILSNLGTFTKFQSYNTISNVIFADICQLFTKTTSLKIKNLTINSFITLLKSESNSLDNFTITEKLLPILHNTSPKNFKNTEFLKNLISLYDQIFTKLSVKPDQLNLEVILEQIFFQLWKLLKHIRTVNLNAYLTQTIQKIEKFLIAKNSENLTNEPETNTLSPIASPPPSTFQSESTFKSTSNGFNNDEDNDDDEFSDFSASSVPIKPQSTSRLQLKSASTQSPLSFGSTSANSVNLASSLKPQSQPATRMTPQRQPAAAPAPQAQSQTSTIDWSAVSKPSAQVSYSQPLQAQLPAQAPAQANLYQPQQNLYQPQQLQQPPINTGGSLPPGFSTGIIQPIKKPATPTLPQSQQQQNNFAWGNGDSLI